MTAESSEGVGARQAPPEQAYLPPAGPEARRTQDNLGRQDDDRTPEEDTTMPSRNNVDEGSNRAGMPRREEVSSSPGSETSDARRTAKSASDLSGSSPPTTTMDAPGSPSAPGARTEEPVQAQAVFAGAPNPDQALAPSPSTCSVSSSAPSGGSIRPAQWLGYWAGGGDITDLSQERNFATVHAALAYYAGVDLLGIL